MLQTTSLISMLGMQAQQLSAQPLQQTMSGAVPAGAQQTAIGGQSIDSADQQAPLFQMILKFMQSPNAASASALQQRLASAASAQHGASESSITLPFPLEANDAPAAEDQSASGVMQYSPFMFTSIAQLQQALQAAMRGQAPVVEEGDSTAPAAVTNMQANAAAESDGKAAKEPGAPSAGAEGTTADALLPVVNAQQPADMAVPASLIGAEAAAQQMPSAAGSAPQRAVAAEAPTQVSAGSALSARMITADEAPIAHERAAAIPQARSVSASSQARPAVAEAEETMPADESVPEFSTELRAALAEAHEAAAPAVVPVARQASTAAAPNAASMQGDARNAAEASAVSAGDPARTPEIFTRLHEAIAQAQEPDVAKNPVKAAPVQQTRSSQKASSDTRTVSAADVKQTPDASAHEEPLGMQPTTAVRAANEQSAEQAQSSAVQAKSDARETTQTAQRTDAATADVRAAAKPELQTPHSALAANDVQTRAAASTHDASTVLSPRAKEDVFEKVFREVSAIKHTPASVDVTLSPESLGKVTVNVGMEEGKMSARINVQNADVKQIIEANMPRLQDALNSSGLSLDSIAVFVNNSSSFADRKNDAPKKKQAAADLAAESAVDTLGTLQRESKQFGYNTVEYIM